MMLRKQLSCAILLAMAGHSAHAFEFYLNKTFGDYSRQNTETTNKAPDVFLFKTHLVDLDNDGDKDIWIGTNQIWLNNGKAQFFKKDDLSEEKDNANNRIILVDIDNDGDIDKIDSNIVYLNDGKANFTISIPHVLSFQREDFAMTPLYFVDLNNDQKLDLFWTRLEHEDLHIGLNDDSVPFIADPNNLNTQFTIQDMTYEEQQAYVPNKYAMIEQSTPSFNVGVIAHDGAGDITFADVDNDGDLDFWAPIRDLDGSISLYFNNGAGQFTESTQQAFLKKLNVNPTAENPYAHLSLAIETGDIDNDGDLDAWVSSISEDFYQVGGEGSPAHILINDGTGQFTPLEQDFGTPLDSTDIKLVDIDNDGDLDGLEVSFTKETPAKDEFRTKILKIWLNDGTGHFTDSHYDIKGFYGAKVEVADLNNDGLKDIVVGNQVWLNGVNKVNISLFDWLEAKFPKLFPKAVKILNFIFGDWEYRYYPSVKTYVGVNTKEQKIYVLGDAFGGLKELGSKKEFLEIISKEQ